MSQSRISSCVVLVYLKFALLVPSVQAVTLEGRVYNGNVGDETEPLSGVTITLYGSNNSGQMGTSITSTTTDSMGWYGLDTREGYEYYNLVETDPSGYTSMGATTVGGTVMNSNWIQYIYPLEGKTLTGNKFWDKSSTPENHPPVAHAGPDQTVNVGDVVQLDGSGSSDIDGDPLTYSWSLTSVPAGSGATLDNPTVVDPKFTPDLAGTYVAQLVVNDGKVDSAPDTVVVTATAQPVELGVLDGYKRDADSDAGLADWRIFIDLNGDGQWDGGEPSDLTDGNGYYRIPDVEPGTYRVCEEMQDGWEPTDGRVCVEGVTIVAGLTTSQDFRNRRTEGPGTQVDVFEMCLVLDLDISGLGRTQVSVSGPATEQVQIGPSGQASDTDGNGRDDAAMDLIGLDLAGMDPVLGQIRVGLAAGTASTGRMEEQVNNTPGILDVLPYTVAGAADSFFDVYLEIQLADLGKTLYSGQPAHWAGVITHVPPATSDAYTGTTSGPIPLVDASAQPAGSLESIAACGATSMRRDFGDAPAPYPDAGHVPGTVWLGFAAPDTETGTQASPLAVGDDTHGIDDEDGAGLMTDLVPGQLSWMALALSGWNQDLTYAVWIDYNGNGQWEHPGELYASGHIVSPLGLVVSNAIPSSAQIGMTTMRVRVYPGKDVPVSPIGDAQGGEVEDYQVEIKRTGEIQPPGHVIAGIKFNDLDGDGSWDPADGELLLPNWTLWLDTNDDGTADLTTTTDSKGGFQFTSVQPGTCTLGEQQEAGWTQTMPAGGGTYTLTVPGGLQPTIAFVMFGNRQTQEDRELDFGDAPDTYKTLLAGGGAYHKAGPLTLGASVDVESDGVPGPDATGDDLAGSDDEDGIVSSLNLTTGQIATISLTVANGDASNDSGIVAGWIDFDGNGLFDLVSDDIGTQYVSVPGGGQSTIQFMFLVPVGAKAGETYARFRLYRDDPNPLAIPWAILPTGGAGYGEVEDYRVNIRSGTSSDDRDYGDAPLPYPSADHPLGGPYLGLFGDLPDRDPGMQRDASASGDDADADGDDEDGLLSVNLVKSPGVWSTAEIKMWTGSTGALTGGIWIDWNADGDWDDSGELVGSAGLSSTPVPPGGAWIHVTWGFPSPSVAQPGNTFARLRVYEGFNVLVSPNGAGGAGEVEDHRVQVKAEGPGLPPGGIVHGYKWDDQDGDGVWDLSEPGLAGWPIWLDLNGSGVEDAGDAYETTDSQGHFRFTGVPAGSYVVGERAQAGWTQTCPAPPGTYTETVTPGSASFPLVFGNTTRPVQPPDGLRRLDWGDAPDPTYPTLRTSNGAYHVILPGLQLGAAVDADQDGQPSPDAMADDNLGLDDEDGVVFLTPILPGMTMALEVLASAAGKVDAWIDFDIDGAWTQATDQILKSMPVTAGSNTLSITVPAGAKVGAATLARFRFSSAGNLPYDGPAQDGEVEDYRVLVGEGGPYAPGEGVRQHLKWSQPPIEIDPNLDPDVQPVFCGWNQPSQSSVLEDQRRVWQIALDDFHCLGPLPVTRLRWWGSYKNWDPLDLPPTLPEAWQITFWINRLEQIDAVPFPERLAWRLDVPAGRVRVQPFGIDRFPQQPAETCFMYELVLEPNEWFRQAEFPSEQDVYWIGITAVYAQGTAERNHWGWKTRPQTWRDPAQLTVLYGEGPNADTTLFPGGLSPMANDLLCGVGQVYDMAFELLTEEPWVKWDLPLPILRDWPYATDRSSMAFEDEKGQIQVLTRVADDWVCRSPAEPVIALAWYGSYIGYGYEACQCQQVTRPRRPDSFLISIWTDAPAGGSSTDSHPDQLIWEYQAQVFDEVLVGYDMNPEGEPNEPVFRYTLRLPEPHWFWQEKADQVHWLSIVAVYKDPVERIAYPWGWTDRPHDAGGMATGIQYDLGVGPGWRILRDPLDRGVDMSFALYTVPQEP